MSRDVDYDKTWCKRLSKSQHMLKMAACFTLNMMNGEPEMISAFLGSTDQLIDSPSDETKYRLLLSQITAFGIQECGFGIALAFPDPSVRRRSPLLSFVAREESGYMELAQSSIARGDLIYVLLGCPVPLVLRKVGSEYALVGECFVLGLMDEEAVNDLDAGKQLLQTFSIL